jgi:hypothetical protein
MIWSISAYAALIRHGGVGHCVSPPLSVLMLLIVAAPSPKDRAPGRQTATPHNVRSHIALDLCLLLLTRPCHLHPSSPLRSPPRDHIHTRRVTRPPPQRNATRGVRSLATAQPTYLAALAMAYSTAYSPVDLGMDDLNLGKVSRSTTATTIAAAKRPWSVRRTYRDSATDERAYLCVGEPADKTSPSPQPSSRPSPSRPSRWPRSSTWWWVRPRRS